MQKGPETIRDLGAGPVKSPLRADHGAHAKRPAARSATCLRLPAKPRDKKGRTEVLPFLFYVASPMMLSWNQVARFLTDWEGLRRMAA